VSCISIFVCFIFLLYIYYVYRTSKLDYKVWDVDTVTPADFTVEYVITKETWNAFLDSETSKTEGTPIYAFKKFLKKEIEEIVEKEEGVLN